MYCSNCGAQVSDNASFCQQCGTKLSGFPCQTDATEKIIMKGLCNRVKSAIMVQNGNAILTNRRFIYMKHAIAKTMIVGAFVNLTKGSYDFEIPLQDIAKIEDGRQGISKTIIIYTKSGEKYNFYFSKREEWKIMLQSSIDAL